MILNPFCSFFFLRICFSISQITTHVNWNATRFTNAFFFHLLPRTEELKEHFGQYGEIDSINVKTDPNTGRSRGFAFIVYKNADSIDKVVAAGDHVINNKKVDPKKAKARHGKIFVGGLTTEISDEEIKTFFGQFGNVSWNFVFDFTTILIKGFYMMITPIQFCL